jgi:hypothetical protein
MFRTLVTLMLMGFCLAAFALDEKDLGTYFVVHNDGSVTSEAFRVFQDNEGWKMQGRQVDGSWKDVLCGSAYCVLRASSKDQVQRMFDRQALSEIIPDCVNTRSFAFCRYTLVKDSKSGGYLFVAIDRTPVVTIRLAKSTGAAK